MTQEMKDVICSKEKHIVLQAYAGSGKTTTIAEYIKANPHERILYMVFSAEMKREAERRFGKSPNCTIKTFHGLCYSWFVNNNRQGRFKDMSNQEIMKRFRNVSQLELKTLFAQYELEFEDLKKIQFYYEYFLASDKKCPTELQLISEEDSMYIHYVKLLWEHHDTSHSTIPHNFYLKKYSLTNPNVGNYDTVLIDECLDGDMHVKTDKGIIKIKNIHQRVQEGEAIRALSFNHDKEIFEYETILGSKKTENRKIFEVKTEGLNKLRCTDNHRVLTQFGYVEVKDLIIGKHQLILDNVFNQKTKYKLNYDQTSMMLGSFLGDGSMDKRSLLDTYRLKFTQGEKQLRYLKMKANVFGLLDTIKPIKSGYTGLSNIFTTDYTKTFILDKNIWKTIEEKFDEKALAIWYMDDGSYSKTHKSVSIHCNNLNDDQVELMKRVMLKKFNIEVSVKKNKQYNYILINTRNSKILLDTTIKYAHNDLAYKWGVERIETEYNWDNNYKEYGGNFVTSISELKTGDVYDIEVDKNHNFVCMASGTKASTSGIVVHNCQDTSDAVKHIISSNLDKKIIAVGDMYQAIMGFNFAKNSLRTLRDQYGFKEYKLTKSFRIGDQLANMCGRLLTWFYDENIAFEGANVSKVEKIDLETIEEQVLIVCRTRLGVLLDSLNVLDKRPDARFYYGGGLDSYDLKEVENILKYKGTIFLEGQRYHISELRKMKKEGLSDVVINGIISRYDFIKKHPNALELLMNSETKNRSEANFIMSTLHGVKGGEAEYVKFGSDIGGVKQLKEKYLKRKEEGVELLVSEIENELNLLYVGLSRATKVLDIGDCFVKEDKLATATDTRKEKSKSYNNASPQVEIGVIHQSSALGR